MFEDQFHISMLIAGQLRGDLTPEQYAELETWLSASESNRAWFNEVTSEQKLPGMLSQYYAGSDEVVWNKTIAKIQRTAHQGGTVRKLYNFNYKITAAAILFLIGTISWFYFYSPGSHHSDPAYANDIRPGKNGATLTLANGRKLFLSDAVNGKVAEEQGVSISKTSSGQLIYKINGSAGGKTDYNTLSTTYGEQYQLVLPDGTRVWLNAGSSLNFPASFASLKERRVELKGEAYFEVVHNAVQPFRVQTDHQLVEDIGTAFNIRSYQDERDTKTTLVTGAA
ncbi:MAG TPA: FecR family protein, partial [Pedobacter sp.]